MAFIRSQVNGRQSRCIVLAAYFCTDVIGAVFWATWCSDHGDSSENRGTCSSLGENRLVLLCVGLPVEGVILFLAGLRPVSFWSDGLLLPLWLVRLICFDVLLWGVSPETLVGNALWFAVMAVMCRVHSLLLIILVVSQICSLCMALVWHGATSWNTFELVRYGYFSVAMLIIVTGAYILDEESRYCSYCQLMSMQGNNSALTERLLRWKVLANAEFESAEQEKVDREKQRGTEAVDLQAESPHGMSWNNSDVEQANRQHPFGGVTAEEIDGRGTWRHRVTEDPEMQSSSCSSGPSSMQQEGVLPLPRCLPAPTARPRGKILVPTTIPAHRRKVQPRRGQVRPRQPSQRSFDPFTNRNFTSLGLLDVLE